MVTTPMALAKLQGTLIWPHTVYISLPVSLLLTQAHLSTGADRAP